MAGTASKVHSFAQVRNGLADVDNDIDNGVENDIENGVENGVENGMVSW